MGNICIVSERHNILHWKINRQSVLGQHIPLSGCVHVFSRLPVKPCTKTMLSYPLALKYLCIFSWYLTQQLHWLTSQKLQSQIHLELQLPTMAAHSHCYSPQNLEFAGYYSVVTLSRRITRLRLRDRRTDSCRSPLQWFCPCSTISSPTRYLGYPKACSLCW